MYCINCGQQMDGNANFCRHSGSARTGAAFARTAAEGISSGAGPSVCVLPTNEPLNRSLIQSRYWVQAGALACGLLTVLHLIVWYGVADGAMRFGSVIGGLICGVAAWKLWTQNSIPAALSALIMLCLEAAGAVFAASSMAKSATGGLGSSAGLFLLSVLMVGVGYQTFRSARRIRRLATKG